MPAPSLAIEVKNLRKSFFLKPRATGLRDRLRNAFVPRMQEHPAVRSISFSAEKGESLAFIGPNGAGKSTTIKMLTGILHPTGGEARVLDIVPWKKRRQLAYRIGTVFGQKSQLWLHLPPMDAFNLLARIYELDRGAYLSRRDELIRLFELEEIVHVPTRKLSLGQRMRCEIAASLLHKPEILFLDEPTIGLDPVAKASIRELIRKVNKEEQVTVFLTSHDAGDIERLCKRVIIINHGKVVMDGPVNSLRRDFLKTKEIDLKLTAEPTGSVEIPGVKTIKAKGFGVKLSVDTTVIPVEKAVSELLRVYTVEDITIQNPEMEQIIAQIYREKRREDHA